MGFTHATPLRQMTGFIVFDWLRDSAQQTGMSQLMDFTLRLTMSHELRDGRV